MGLLLSRVKSDFLEVAAESRVLTDLETLVEVACSPLRLRSGANTLTTAPNLLKTFPCHESASRVDMRSTPVHEMFFIHTDLATNKLKVLSSLPEHEPVLHA